MYLQEEIDRAVRASMALRVAMRPFRDPAYCGRIFRGARLYLGLSQGEMARRMRVANSWLCRVERGQVPVGPKAVRKLQRMLASKEKST
jgi:hypothetical protein